MQTELRKVYATEDGEGHWYVIPFEIKDHFSEMLREAEKTDEYEEFEQWYGGYRTGGDLNNIQLYAEI